MSDEHKEVNNDEVSSEQGNLLDNVSKLNVSNTYGDTSELFSEETLKKLEDVLRTVDDSNLPPAPASNRPVINIPMGRSSNTAQRTDKYGLPVKESEKLAHREMKSGKSAVSANASSDSKSNSLKLNAILEKEEPDVSMPNFNEPELDVGPPDFKIKFDFESAYKNVPENRPLRRRRERRTGLVGGLMYAVFILCVSLILASIMWMATMEVLGFAAEDETFDVVVPPDFTMEGITDMLFDAGLIRYKALFNLYADYTDAEEKISPGSYILNKNFDYRALVQGMTARAGVRVETTVTIPEGFTLAQIFNLLENEDVCSASELWVTATYHDFDFHFLDKETIGNRNRLEGFLFPDTYNFYKDSTPVQAIARMLREFDRKFTEMYIERADLLGYTVREIITIASMVEREAGDNDERPRIAAVIYNRLDSPNFPMLEIDATIHYAIAGTGMHFSTQIESEYNTYLHPGLPPGPIANPGLASIRAALYPASSNDYYYALNKQGTHNFFRNFNDHNNFVNSDEYGG